MGVLKLTQIWIYPIKSLGGISLTAAKVMGKGLKYDRRWMLVDEDGVFITQRVYPSMALFHQRLDNGCLTVSHGEDSIVIPLDRHSYDNGFDVKIWADTVAAFEVSPEHSRWFSDRLGFSCKLVAFPEEKPRRVDPDHVSKEEHVSLADAYPFLLIGESSLDDLNERLSQPVTIKRFRPNLVFSGGKPYEEDTWKQFSIGTTNFEGIKPCARCVLTTVDPETGIKGSEPLKTLASYRKKDNKIYFGQNVIAHDHSTIRVGDDIAVHTHSLLKNEMALKKVSS